MSPFACITTFPFTLTHNFSAATRQKLIFFFRHREKIQFWWEIFFSLRAFFCRIFPIIFWKKYSLLLTSPLAVSRFNTRQPCGHCATDGRIFLLRFLFHTKKIPIFILGHFSQILHTHTRAYAISPRRHASPGWPCTYGLATRVYIYKRRRRHQWDMASAKNCVGNKMCFMCVWRRRRWRRMEGMAAVPVPPTAARRCATSNSCLHTLYSVRPYFFLVCTLEKLFECGGAPHPPCCFIAFSVVGHFYLHFLLMFLNIFFCSISLFIYLKFPCDC